MRYIENDCVGCPQGCINCGRNKNYEVIECDRCGNSEETMYEYETQELCEDCLFEVWLSNNEADLLKWEGGADFLEDPDPDYLPADFEKAWDEFRLECRIEEDY